MDDGIFLDTLIGLRARNWWLTAVRRCRVTGLTVLRRQAEKARKMHLHADHPYATSENRFARLRTGDDTIPKAFNSDWAWRPEIWRDPLPTACGSPVASHTVLSDGVTLFHDGSGSGLTLSQAPNRLDIGTERALAYTALNEKRIEHAWIDLIFERPRINRITLRGLAFSRRPRAEF